MKKLCQVSGKHTVGGIVFYKHLFLVFIVNMLTDTLVFHFCVNIIYIRSTSITQRPQGTYTYALELCSQTWWRKPESQVKTTDLGQAITILPQALT